MTSKFNCIEWNHVLREENFVAAVVAHLGLTLDISHLWDHCLPYVVFNVLNFDCLGFGCRRGFPL